MSGLLPVEGYHVVYEMLLKKASADRGTSLQLGLFTNSYISNNELLAYMTEPTGGGYARKTLVDANWTITQNLASYAAQVFTATGSNYVGAIYGYFICTTGTAPALLALEMDPNGPITLLATNTYTVTPQIQAS